MISLNAKITKKIENNFRKFNFLSKPIKSNLKELIKGMILKKTCYLSEIGRLQSPETNDRQNIERYCNSLVKTNSFEVLRIHMKSKKKWINEDDKDLIFPKNPNLILVDGGEIEKKNCPKKFQKEGSRKMEYCCGIVDGSNHHKPSWGYKLLNISLHTSHNSRTHILSQHLFSSNAPDYKGDWHEQKRQFQQIKEIINPQNSIIIEDSIGDDAQRINFYKNEMKNNFIVRSQNKRKYKVDFEGDKFLMKLGEIGENIEYNQKNTRTYFDKKAQKEVISRVAYISVKHKDLKNNLKEPHELFLVLVKSENYETPMGFLTNIEPKTTEEAWKIFFWYKKRWEVEKIYREIKQKFKLESGLIRSYKAWQTLVVLTALAWEFLQELTLDLRCFLGDCYPIFMNWLKKKQQKKITHLNFLDWIREFLAYYCPPFSQRFYRWNIFLNRFKKPENQPSLFGNWKKIRNC